MRCYKKQQGLALLLFMLVLLSIGGVLLTASLQKTKQEIDDTRYQYNKRILNEAKQMLLYHAYRYPDFNSETKGPGYLPCPYDTETGYSGGAISLVICEAVGRFPYNLTNLGFHEVKDASGEHLWYAVSENFYTLGATTFINSNTKGTISIYDQAANLIYDGAVDGIAAIIIAPGPRINRDDNGDGVYDYEQVRLTPANKLNPKNYLDAFNGFDNAVFQNSSNTLANSFILGPNFNPDNHEIVINDQIMIVTTEEVLDMAKKSVLEQYSLAIEDYRSKTGGAYPWLFDYSTSDITAFPNGAALTNIGRIPSTFDSYFVDKNTNSYDSELFISPITKTYSVGGVTYSLTLDGITSTATNVRFSDNGDDTDGQGGIIATTGGFMESFQYFWDDFANPNGWEICPIANVVAVVSDCDRKADGTIDAGDGNDSRSKLLKVGVRFDMALNPTTVLITYEEVPPALPVPPPVISYTPATSTNHAFINATAPIDQFTIPAQIYYEQMDLFDVGDTVFVANSSGAQDIFSNSDLGAISGQSVTPDPAAAPIPLLTVGVRYYPELPLWAAPDKSDWNSRIQMAIATEYQPGGAVADCALHADGCLQISDLGGNNNNKIAILAVAGQGDFIDEANDGFANDVGDIFDAENANLNFVFTGNVLSGSDRLFVIQEQ